MNLKNVVWTAVVALALGLGSIISGLQGNGELALALGLGSISSAVLSSRERR